MRPYSQIAGLEAIYLEDSYVLGIHESADELRFELEAVLMETHPKLSPPKKDEQYAYLGIDLVFPGLRQAKWPERKMQPFRDASGDVDCGNIDTFVWDNALRANGRLGQGTDRVSYA